MDQQVTNATKHNMLHGMAEGPVFVGVIHLLSRLLRGNRMFNNDSILPVFDEFRGENRLPFACLQILNSRLKVRGLFLTFKEQHADAFILEEPLPSFSELFAS